MLSESSIYGQQELPFSPAMASQHISLRLRERQIFVYSSLVISSMGTACRSSSSPFVLSCWVVARRRRRDSGRECGRIGSLSMNKCCVSVKPTSACAELPSHWHPVLANNGRKQLVYTTAVGGCVRTRVQCKMDSTL